MDGISPIVAIAAIVVGYLAGSVPFGLLLTRAAGLADVRTLGSGNIGATNVLRTGSKPVAAATLVCDIGKGTLAVVAFGLWAGDAAGLIAGMAAFAGHIFPVWLRFRGGKGVATYLGVLLGLNWLYAVVFVVIWLAMALAFRISSLAALTASLVLPLAVIYDERWLLAAGVAVMGLVIFFTHRGNIARLARGEESRIAFTRKPVR